MSHDRSLFQLALSALPAARLHVHAIIGKEQLSAAYHFDIEVSAARVDEELLVSQWVGQRAQLLLRVAQPVRAFAGMVASVRALGPALEGGSALAGRAARYRIRLVPQLWALRFVRRSRIFQNLRVDEIIDQVLEEAQLGRRWLLTQSYPKRPYCTQYEESDLAFVLRLLAECGIVFRFEQPIVDEVGVEEMALGQGEVLVFYDDAHASPNVNTSHSFGAMGSSARFSFRSPAEALGSARPTIDQFETEQRLRTRSATYWEYDPARPLASLHATTAAGAVTENIVASTLSHPPELEYYEHHARFSFPDWAYGMGEPQRIVKQLRRDAAIAKGASDIQSFSVGFQFHLEDHPLLSLNGAYCLTEVAHEGWDTPTEQRKCYRNRFECVAAEVLYCLPRPQRQQVLAPLTATVVGPAGSEIYTDAMGRIKVQFHWDREGQRDEHSSCWIRTTQAWSGQGWGSQFVPRVGMEVVVAFDGGDADKPIVLGCVNNGLHQPAFSLPGQQTRSGFRTRSTPDADGFNELSFDDKAGHEQVYLQAERDLVALVKHDESTTIGNNQTLVVGGDQSTRVTGARLHETASSSVTKTMGHAELHVGGEYRQLVGNNYRRTIDGDDILRVRGKSLHSISEDHNLRVEGTLAVNVGTADSPSSTDVFSWGNTMVGAGIGLSLRADEQVTLECGDSAILMYPDRIELRAPKLVIAADKEVRLSADGPILRLDKNAEMSAEVLKLYSAGASVELDGDAHVNGRTVKINCDMTTAGGKTDDSGVPLLQPLMLTLTNAKFEPYAHKPFVVKAGGQRVEGTTDATGALRVEIPAEATAAEVTLWLGQRAASETRRYVIELREQADIHTIIGVQTRLRHLGYYHRKPSAEEDAAMQQGVRDFQRDHDLEATGELDDATRRLLLDVHGS